MSRYAVVGVYPTGAKDPQIMSAGGQIILFDTPAIAANFLPMLGNGRICSQSADGETAVFSPIDVHGINRAVVLTGYDPFNVPAGMNIGSADGTRVYHIRSEAHSRSWRCHVMWTSVFCDVGQMERRRDGTYRNAATREE